MALLGQLTVAGDVTREQFDGTMARGLHRDTRHVTQDAFTNCSSVATTTRLWSLKVCVLIRVPGAYAHILRYYHSDIDKQRVIGTATMFVELKFLRACGKVCT